MKKKTTKRLNRQRIKAPKLLPNLPPKALKLPPIKPTDYVRGTIAYEVRCLDWRPLLTTKEPQKFKFDSNGCSQCSGMNSPETQFNLIKKDLSPEAVKWFTDNGYFDTNGNLDCSWIFTGILAGTSINGNSQVAFWDSVRKYGLLPRKDLNYSFEQSQKFSTQEEMCKDLWNPDRITQEMKNKAIQALKYINVEYEYVWYNLNKSCPISLLREELKHAPLHIGTPACYSWNSGDVKSCGKTHPEHATMLFAVNDDGSTVIRDQYNPYDKTLAADYPISVVVKGVVTIKDPMLSPVLSMSVWKQIVAILRQLGLVTKGVFGLV